MQQQRVGASYYVRQEEDFDDPFAPKNRNVLKEYWDEFMGSIYSWYYSISGKLSDEATRTRKD
jgi:hypothetical protein